jgi:AcrR family transcriptional regulator
MRADVTAALARAFFDEWARVGFAALSLERVAEKAGVGKAALYRRWPSKAEMASALLSQIGTNITKTDDRGSLRADLLALLLAIRRVLRHTKIRRILADLHAEIGREPALEEAIRPFQRARRKQAEIIVDRAIMRGDLPAAVDRETISDFIAAPLYWRMVVIGGRSDRRYVERLASMTTAAVMEAALTEVRLG